MADRNTRARLHQVADLAGGWLESSPRPVAPAADISIMGLALGGSLPEAHSDPAKFASAAG